jgi:hypothetical protein
MIVYNKGEPFIFLYITLGIMLTLDPKSQSAFLKVLLTQNVHSAPITQQAEKLSFARAGRE